MGIIVSSVNGYTVCSVISYESFIMLFSDQKKTQFSNSGQSLA